MPNPRLPLVDLHRHLDGNIRPHTIWQLANQYNIELPAKNLNDFIPFVQIQQSEPDLVSFLKKLDWGVAVLTSLDDCKRIAYENVEDAFNAGLDYAELRFSPFYMAMKHQLNVTDVVAAVVDGIKAGCRDFDVKINLIGILSRSFGVDNCQIELDALLAHKHELVAMDLAGDERGFAGELFLSHFEQVRNADLQVTIHAGEACGPESVWQAIRDLGATRIGHGVACAKDPKLLDYMVKNNIIVESCLTSNFQTGTVTDLSKHPLKLFLQHGVVACLNTDDPAVEGIEIKHEYQVAREQLGLNQTELDRLQLNGVTASFLSASEKQQLRLKAQSSNIAAET